MRTNILILISVCMLLSLNSCKNLFSSNASSESYYDISNALSKDVGNNDKEGSLSDAEKDKIINDYVNSMVYVKGGTFTMGATREQGSDVEDDEKPAHSVRLSSYYIGQTEVTQELWEAVMGSNPSDFKGAKRPVENVSWDDCQEFIRKLNAKTGKQFRLPTEAEWEYAARGGNRSQGYKYSGGNNIDDVAWYYDNSGSARQARIAHDVASKRANELGIYDMSGNVSEWCQDNWYYYDGSAADASYRVCRGGGCTDTAWRCRVSIRNGFLADALAAGLRLAL